MGHHMCSLALSLGALLLLPSVLSACAPSEPSAAQAGESSAVNQAPTDGAEVPAASAKGAVTQPKSSELIKVRQPSDRQQQLVITDPQPGSPEAVIQQLLMGAMDPDVNAGWERTKGLLHSAKVPTLRGLQSYREMNYPASRRKVALFTPDDAKPHFLVTRTIVKAEDHVTIFVHNEKSMPTPCSLRRDAKADNAWRVYDCSL